MDGGRLCAILASETTSLRRLISEAVRTTTGEGLHPGGVMSVSRPQFERALSVVVTPVQAGGAGHGNLGQAAAAILISNPDQPQSPDVAVLRTLFRLTDAECRLVVALCSGLSLAAAAASLKIARETAKSHLKQVFAKTATSRQSELVAVVGRLAGRNAVSLQR